MRKSLALLLAALLLAFAGCSAQWDWDRMNSGTRFKQITPAMEVRLKESRRQGCRGSYQILDPRSAELYSIFPGGGQFYTGETKKAFLYMIGSILIVPYFIAFEDAQRSVDYYNYKYTVEFCEEKLRAARGAGEQGIRLDLIK